MDSCSHFRAGWWLAMLLPLMEQAAGASLVNHAAPWLYHQGTTAPQADWKTAADDALDASWLSGPGGIGYGDGDDATVLSDMRNRYTTVYLRRSFTVGAPLATDWHALLTMDWDDGFVAWLDGTEVARDRAPGSIGAEPAFNAVATGLHEASGGNSSPNPPATFDLGPAATLLAPGTHVLAIMGLNESRTSSDLSVIADLEAAPPPPPPPGAIVTDTHWTTAGSPRVLNGTLTIARGATLTIDPGVELQFAPGADLVVNGRLLAEGNETNRIHFTRAPGAGSWGGIVINDAGGAETRIGYAHIDANGTTAIHSSGGTVRLDHLTFGTTSHQYVSLDNSSFIVSDCVFPTSTTGFELVHGKSGIKRGGRAIFLRNFFGATRGYNDVVDFTGGNRPGPIVQFIDNVFTGASDDHLDLDSTDAWIEHNIFLHAHKNGSPDTASGVSGGADNADTSEITIIGNLFYDCDQAAMAKQGNFYTLINNTIVHQTHEGGLDTDGAVVALADAGTSRARGMYLEGNIIFDAEKLTRFRSSALVTFTNNFTSLPWSGPGGGNSAADPMLTYIPQLSETRFSSWAEAQVMWDWFTPQPGSPALGAGPNGTDAGGVIPLGVSLSSAPTGTTTNSSAIFRVGVNRTGHGIPAAGWPKGSGYTHYQWRLDENDWSASRPLDTPITLTDLPDGPHFVEVVGQRDSGWFQDDPALGPDAVVTRTPTWVVRRYAPLRIQAAQPDGNTLAITFQTEAGQTYSLLRSPTLAPARWQKVADLLEVSAAVPGQLIDPDTTGSPTWFYRLVTPARP